MRPDATGGPSGLDLRVRTRDSTVEVTVAGDLDMSVALKLETQVDAVLAAEEVSAIALDLSDVQFMDSAGLGALLNLRERAEELDVDLAIARVSAPVRRILDVAGLGGIAEP